MKFVFNLFLIFYLIVCTLADYVKFVTELPGWDGPMPSKTFDGYLDVANNTKSLHFMFWQSMSSPKDDPLMVWLQGGPGASGLMGLFTEFGPFNLNQFSFHTSDMSNELPTMLPNQHTWMKYANYIIVESPVGVGFSYCKTEECPVNTDHTQAVDLYEFMQKFFENFPEFRNNDFYVTGESYGGLYVPMLANQIHDHNTENKQPHINLKGILIGNGCTGVNVDGTCAADSPMVLAKFLHGRGQMSTKTYNNLMTCTLDNFTDECKGYNDQMYQETGAHFFYNIFDECFSYEHSNKKPAEANYDYPCFFEAAVTHWANHPQTKQFFNSNKTWQQIRTEPNGDRWAMYEQSVTDVIAYYEKLLEAGYKVTIYFGDVDTAVSAVGGELAANHLGKNPEKTWQPWTTDADTEVAGYWMKFENNFTFITIRGAGHMVPQNKPEAAEVLFNAFVKGEDLPPYKFYQNYNKI